MSVRKIGRYEVIEEIGRGGMATVYSAHDPAFNRKVAIKMLPAELLHDPTFRARFQREAQTIATLEYPAIVPVYDFGEVDGKPYFVMRLMTGNSLSERIAQGQMPLEEAARIFARIAPALDAAHQRGVVHRDIKPGNILFDQYNEPYLSDFGIAKLSETSSTLTGTAIVGTPAYMSPEQARGETDLDGRSDIYSLGAILFEMLSGRVPYESDTAVGQVFKHIKEPIPNILELRPDLPPECQEIIIRAMAKRKFGRYAKATDMANALLAVAGGQMPLSHGASATLTMLPPEMAISEDDKPTEQDARKPPTPKPATPKPATPGRGSSSRPSQSSAKPGKTIEPQAKPKKGTPNVGATVAVLGLVVVVLGIASSIFIPAWLKTQESLRTPQATSLQLADTTSPTALVAEQLPSATVPVVEAAITTPTLTDTPSLPTDAPVASDTPTLPPTITPTPEPQGPTIGGADKIAFLNGNEVWVANLDGSGLRQLTSSGGIKSGLQWSPDGNTLFYIVGRCVYMVTTGSTPAESTLLCANWAEYLADFEISPNGEYVAISLSDGLFILPYDLPILSQIRRQDQLEAIDSCLTYTSVKTKTIQWSNDSRRIAAIVLGTDGNRQVELIRVMDIGQCDQSPTVIDEFPGTRFAMRYSDSSSIQSFAWDGETLFVLNVNVLNGFGDIYLYNMATHKAEVLNPLFNACCFRDFDWGPDDNYLMFAFQDSRYALETVLYYIPYNTLGSGYQYTPIPLGEGFIADRQAKPQAILRPSE